MSSLYSPDLSKYPIGFHRDPPNVNFWKRCVGRMVEKYMAIFTLKSYPGKLKELENKNYLKNKKFRPKPPKTKNIPDVFVILVDSMSSRMMKRSLAKTVEFMTQQFQAVDFPFYSQVASRSPGNARSLWFGRFDASALY